MTRRLQLVIAYDGSVFRGWQSQAGGETIQDRLEAAFATVTGKEVRVHGAGRTDAGVHALAQSAHVDVAAAPPRLNVETWRNALNASLPPQIRIVACRFRSQTFHARFSAKGKVYRYRIVTTPILSPFEIGRAWHLRAALEDKLLRECAAMFAGRHDYAGFAANRGTPPETTVRTIRVVRVRRTSALTVLEFDGDGFLYKMVRLMVGAIVRAATGREPLHEIRRRLRKAETTGARLVAPAAGLTLVRVRY